MGIRHGLTEFFEGFIEGAQEEKEKVDQEKKEELEEEIRGNLEPRFSDRLWGAFREGWDAAGRGE